LQQLLGHLDELNAHITTLSQQIATVTHPYADLIERLCAIPGVGRHTAEIVLAERAAMAVAHSILMVIYPLLDDPNAVFTDLGDDYFLNKNKAQARRWAVSRLESLGFEVELTASPTECRRSALSHRALRWTGWDRHMD